jgi:hypothetical protein
MLGYSTPSTITFLERGSEVHFRSLYSSDVTESFHFFEFLRPSANLSPSYSSCRRSLGIYFRGLGCLPSLCANFNETDFFRLVSSVCLCPVRDLLTLARQSFAPSVCKNFWKPILARAILFSSASADLEVQPI